MPGLGLGKPFLAASDVKAEALEAQGLAMRVKVHCGYDQGCSPRLGAWIARFVVIKREHLLELSQMVWSWEAWGRVRVGIRHLLTQVFHVLAKGFPIFYLWWVH